jgi:two-component system, OmpR family, sensor histidine kinase ChvG
MVASEVRPDTAPARVGKSNARAATRRRRRVSGLTLRILAINSLSILLLAGGLMYLNVYERGLIESEVGALRTQADIFAAAIGENAVSSEAGEPPELGADEARPLLRRLVEATTVRARIFALSGDLIADTRFLVGAGGLIEVTDLAPPKQTSPIVSFFYGVYDWVLQLLPARRDYQPYEEQAKQRADDYFEVVDALLGEPAYAIRTRRDGRFVINVAVPIQNYKRVLGSLLLSVDSGAIEAAVREVRLDILRLVALAAAVTVLLSIYLAGAISRPLRRLAAAAERVRRGLGRTQTIPDFTHRGDEIGDLSRSLRAMTSALWERIDAIERFAADVAHEIKNPLTSLRSAVETSQRIDNPDMLRRLMVIILEDVKRLDRLISDISSASRLEGELSRAEMQPVDLARLAETLVDVHRTTARDGGPGLKLEIEPGVKLVANGIEGRLVQVLSNLISNALSFSPPDGTIRIGLGRNRDQIVLSVEDEGPGIPDGKLEAIFERFYSERPADEKFGQHSGLGLSISKQIVEAHNGSLHAENRTDSDGKVKGARFVLSVPAID